jgi:phospholipid/cholesterol/gamma-HCH transport system substrate-binding protein
MTGRAGLHRVLGIGCCVVMTGTGCAFNGMNSLPLPGTAGHGPGASTYHVEIANVGSLDSNSPVMIDDVVVGSVGPMTVKGWHADVEISVQPGVVVPANAVASVGQTSLLGSMHLSLDPPLGQPAAGQLRPGATIPLNRTAAYPSTEQTLASLSAVVNAGGLGQFGDIVHNFNAALSGRQGAVRDLLERLDRFIGTFDQQRDSLVASIDGLNRLAGTLAGQRDVIATALRKIPPALEVLNKERPRLLTALDKLRVFSDTATELVNDAGGDLAKNLQNLAPALGALADVGPDLDAALSYAPTFPFTQSVIDRFVRGDYMNGYFTVDLTNAGLRKTILLGTHWGRLGAEAVPAPGDPEYLQFKFGAPPKAPGSVVPPGALPAAAPNADQDSPPPGILPPAATPVEGSG